MPCNSRDRPLFQASAPPTPCPSDRFPNFEHDVLPIQNSTRSPTVSSSFIRYSSLKPGFLRFVVISGSPTVQLSTRIVHTLGTLRGGTDQSCPVPSRWSTNFHTHIMVEVSVKFPISVQASRSIQRVNVAEYNRLDIQGRWCKDIPGGSESQSCCLTCPIADWRYPEGSEYLICQCCICIDTPGRSK